MKERPILFSGPMIRAILEGRKTQTRRVMKPQPASVEYWLHGKRSDRLHGLPSMRDETGQGWSMCGPFRCPYIAEGMYAGEAGKLGNSRIDDITERKSLLWVRETWRTRREWDAIAPSKLPLQFEIEDPVNWRWAREQYIHYAESPEQNGVLHGKLRPSIFLPRWASRITLEVTGVRVERLQQITTADAQAEGFPYDGPQPEGARVRWYRELWNSINGPNAWSVNPWVWVVEFQPVKEVAHV